MGSFPNEGSPHEYRLGRTVKAGHSIHDLVGYAVLCITVLTHLQGFPVVGLALFHGALYRVIDFKYEAGRGPPN